MMRFERLLLLALALISIGVEGTEIWDWLTSRGITCIVAKYRAPGGDDFRDSKLQRQITPAIPRALQDAQRTIRLVRSKAGELGVNPRRTGALGMSAGAVLAPWVRPLARPAEELQSITLVGKLPQIQKGERWVS